MKIVRCLAVIGFLILTANIALADSAGDPKMYATGGGHSVPITSLTNDPNFVINYTAGVTPTLGCETYGGVEGNTCIFTDFVNDTGQTWTGISFLITSVGGSVTENSFTVDNSLDPYFTMAAVSFDNAGQAILSFFGTDPTHPGILPADPGSCNSDGGCTGPYSGEGEFAIPLFDFGILVDVTDALNQGDSFTAQGSAAVPEPKTIVLLLAGAALVGLFLSKRAA